MTPQNPDFDTKRHRGVTAGGDSSAAAAGASVCSEVTRPKGTGSRAADGTELAPVVPGVPDAEGLLFFDHATERYAPCDVPAPELLEIAREDFRAQAGRPIRVERLGPGPLVSDTFEADDEMLPVVAGGQGRSAEAVAVDAAAVAWCLAFIVGIAAGVLLAAWRGGAS